jgi:hypothetical protein
MTATFPFKTCRSDNEQVIPNSYSIGNRPHLAIADMDSRYSIITKANSPVWPMGYSVGGEGQNTSSLVPHC